MASKNNLSVVIDLGTSKMVALAGELTEEGKMEIVASAKIPSKGIKRGVISNIDEASECVNELIELIEEELEGQVKEVNVAMAGQRMLTVNFETSTETSGDGFVDQSDVDELFSEAKNVELQEGYRVLSIIPTSYCIDDESEVFNPVGCTGNKIEARYKLVVISESYYNNLLLVLKRAGLKLGQLIHASLAVSEAVVNKEEKEVGVIVVDFGAGNTNLAIFQNDALVHTSVIPFGGQVVSSDIKEGCAISLDKAEQLKVKYGEAMGDFADEQKVVTIAGENGWEPRDISFKSLAYIIQARMEEIIECVYVQIEKAGIEDSVGSGIVITGGAARLKNTVSLVKYKTAMDARRAHPVILPINATEEMKDTEFMTALGALKMVLVAAESGLPKVIAKKAVKRTPKGERGIVPLFKGVVQGALNLFDVENSDEELN